MRGSRPFELEMTLHGEHFEFHAAPLRSMQKGWVCSLHNITVRKQTQDMLQRRAFHDVLTQLPNRAYFRDHLQRAYLRSKSEADYRFAALFIDMDSLKSINDKWGHDAGDQALMQFARRLESSIRPGDLAARLGGDEFAVFIDGVADEDRARQVATRIRDALAQPFKLPGDAEVHTTASIGMALAGALTADVDALLRNADQAMYRVKQRGGNGFEMFGEEILTDVKPQ